LKYFENTLVLIANEAERLQLVKFTHKEELTITVLILLLTASHACNPDQSRAYYLYDLFNKLAINVPGV
jgi:hypothetical protein